MNRIILIAVLMISLLGRSYAQNEETNWREKRWRISKTERTFNMIPADACIRDYIYLRNGTIILELTNVADFNRLNNLDSILLRFRNDIAFYNDSLEKYPGNVRIDYVLVEGHDFAQIRFKKHAPDGEFFVNKDDQVSRLKLEQDTVRIVMHVKGKETYIKSGVSKEKKANRPQYTIQVTFCLDNYKDIDKMIADKQMLQHAIDTLRSTKSRRTIANPFVNPSSSLYRPYSEKYNHLERFNGIIKSDYFTPDNITNRSDKVTLGIGMGIGVIRNTLAPMAEINLAYINRRGYKDGNDFTLVQLSATPFFFFDRSPDGQFFVKDNWFVNAEVGSPADIYGIHTKLFTAGVGYLLVQKGDYFKGTTMKAFIGVKLKSSITVCPEVIFTNNFKQIFPGITVKIL